MNSYEELLLKINSDDTAKKEYQIENELYSITATLKNIRKMQKFTQKTISQKSGLSQQMVSKIESYNGNPSLESFVRYCDSVNVSILDLLEEAMKKINSNN